MKQVGLLLILFSSVASVHAQKIKYKDLYVLLSANDYDQALPFLRRFLIQDPDHPNANFNMAKYYEYAMDQKDMLKEGDEFVAYGDSCYSYYEKSYALITEKEVKKNDKYYQDYYRRDLRTGKYGVKLTDIQLDVETKMADLKSMMNSVSKMSSSFKLFTIKYDSAITIYNSIFSSYPNYKEFLFNSGMNELGKLSELGIVFSECIKNFALYESYSESIESTPYNQSLAQKLMNGFEPAEQPDYFADRIDLIDFTDWANYTGGIIVNDIIPLTNKLVEYDAKLDVLAEDARGGKNVGLELNTLSSSANFARLRNYDENPLPIHLFKFKQTEIGYYSKESQKKIDGVYDSLNLDFQYMHYQQALDDLEKIGHIYEVVRKQDLNEANKLYGQFITSRYTNTDGLRTVMQKMASSLQTESDRIISEVDALTLRMQWASSETDSLPMILSDSLAFQTPVLTMRNATVLIDSLVSGYWIGGFRLHIDKVSTYIAKVDANRNIDTLSMQVLISPSEDQYLTDLQSIGVPSLGQLFFVLYGRNSNKHFCQVNLIDTENEAIVWSKQVSPTSRLVSARINNEGGIVLQFLPASIEEEDNGDVPQVVNLGPSGDIIQLDN